MSISPALRSEFVHTIGSYIIGATASTGLLGITTLQSWIYYTRFPKDAPLIKALVLIIWCLEATRTTICVYGGYYYAVEHWGDIFALMEKNWTLTTVMILTSPIELLAHLFFAHQIGSIVTGNNRLLSYFIAILSIVGFGLGVASYITAIIDGTMSGSVHGPPARIAIGSLACAIIADWTITICLVSFLRDNRTVRVRTLMQTLILYAVNFGLLISLTDLAVIIMVNVKWPYLNLYQLSLFEVVGNLYANTVLASLNSRILVAEHVNRPGNLHVTSINAVSTQIHGFHPPANHLSTSSGGFHVRTFGDNEASHTDAMGSPNTNRGPDRSTDTLDLVTHDKGENIELTRV